MCIRDRSNVVGELVGVIVKPLLAFLGAPYANAVFYKPFHHKGRFVCDPSYAVKHEYQQNIKLALFGVFLDDLQLVAFFCSYFVAGHAILLFLVEDRPALFLGEAVAGFALHWNIRLASVIVIHLFIGRNSV